MHKLTLSFKGRTLKVFHITGNQTLIGRSPDCDIPIDNLAVSPTHARVSFENDEVTITDISNDKTLRVNDKKTDKHTLAHGDVIQIGKHTLTYTVEVSTLDESSFTNTSAENLSNVSGWLQFMSGPKLGRTMRLDRALTRLGKTGKQSAMVASRNGQYYISHFEGEQCTKVKGRDIGEQSVQLKEGDTVQIGDIKMMFFTSK
ncbi:MAG: FHA domain-containing protein [Gammaproteobacteria bacterium]|nr:FHA domain-containing protein [Gammaproteobacteria bacterium]